MSQKSPLGLRARVVASRRTICDQFAGLSARAIEYGSGASARVREILSACAAAAIPQVHPAIESLEGRQLLSTTVYAATAAPDASSQNVQDGIWTSNNGLELGAKFTSDVNGSITGVRFYKGSLNTGTHTGEVWSSTGTLVATATFTNETASGWQEADFSSPVPVSAGATYVVAYHTHAQYMAFTPNAMGSELNNGSVHLLASGANGYDGVFNYGYNSVFPTLGYETGSYWVDAVFSPSVSAPASPVPTGIVSANSPSASIALQGGNGQAEHSIFVNALSSSLGDGTQLNASYAWNFGDAASAYNNLTGWNASHIYDNPGTYTITLTVTNELGLSSTAATQVTITPSTRTTIYVNNYGNDANSGLSANQPIASELRLEQILGSYGNSNVSVLFERGQTFNMPYYLYVEGSNESFGAYGSGAAPVLMKTPGDPGIFYMTASANQIVIENLTFDSPNVATVYNAPEMTATAIYPNGTNITVRNNTFLNLEDAMDCYQGPNGLLVENNSAPSITGLRGYFMWMNGSNGVVLGNTVVNSTRQHIMRSSFNSTQDWLIAGNNFTGNNDPYDPNEIVKTTINIREGSDIDITDNILTGASVAFGPEVANGPGAYADWILLNGNEILNTQLQLAGGVHHFDARNNYFNLGGEYPAIQLVPTNIYFPTQTMADITLDHNTLVTNSNIAFFLEVYGPSPTGIISVKNNLFSDPNYEAGWNMAAPVYVVSPQLNSVFGAVANNIWPTSGNPVLPNEEMYASTSLENLSGYITNSAWAGQWFVQNDQFRNVSASLSTGLATTVGSQTIGAVLPAAIS
jgi:PKD repeat protein